MSTQKKLAVFLRLFIKARNKLSTQEIIKLSLDQLLERVGLDNDFLANAEEKDIDKVVRHLDTLYKEQLEIDLLTKQVRYLSTSDLKTTKLEELLYELNVKTSAIHTVQKKFNAENLEIKARIAEKMGNIETAKKLQEVAKLTAIKAAAAQKKLAIEQAEQKARNDLRQLRQLRQSRQHDNEGESAAIEETGASSYTTRRSREHDSNVQGSISEDGNSQTRRHNIAERDRDASSEGSLSIEENGVQTNRTRQRRLAENEEEQSTRTEIPRIEEDDAAAAARASSAVLEEKRQIAETERQNQIAETQIQIAENEDQRQNQIAEEQNQIAENQRQIAENQRQRQIAEAQRQFEENQRRLASSSSASSSVGSGGLKESVIEAAADELMELQCAPHGLVLKPVLGQISTKVSDVLEKCNGPLTKVPGGYECGFTAPWQGQHTYEVWGDDVIIGPGIHHFWECTSYKTQIYWGMHHICAACFYEMCRLKANGDLDEKTLKDMIN